MDPWVAAGISDAAAVAPEVAAVTAAAVAAVGLSLAIFRARQREGVAGCGKLRHGKAHIIHAWPSRDVPRLFTRLESEFSGSLPLSITT